jgi:hypothetical protein
MRKLFLSAIVASLVGTPLQAQGWPDQTVDVRQGAFIGARLSVPMGRNAAVKPRAALTIAPTQSRISADGMVRTQIGEGLALNLASHAKPSLTFAGARVDYVLGLKSQDQVESNKKLGMSSTGWVAVGAATIALVGGAYVLHLKDVAEDNTE